MAHGAVRRGADRLGHGAESVRTWVKHADIDDEMPVGVITSESEKVRELE